MRSRTSFSYLAAMVLAAIVFVPATQLPAAPAAAEHAPSSFADLAEQVKHAVVNIFTTRIEKGAKNPLMAPDSPFREFFGDEFGKMPQGETRTQALGSGLIIGSDGLILTNNHVVEKADEIKVKTDTGKEFDAKVVGRDPKTDLALIKVNAGQNFPNPATLGDSDAIRVGDWVMAVGNPFGLDYTVTSGIISAKGRVIGAGPYDDFLQTDAAINPGNSGGPLFNMKGEVVGISTAIVAQGQGIGFATPINIAKQLLPQLKTGKIVRGWLGIAIQDLTPDLSKALGLTETKGVLVGDVVEGSPAEKGGIERGDVIVTLAGKEVANAHELSSRVASMKPESQVEVGIVRNGEARALKFALGTMPEEPGKLSEKTENTWGLTVKNIGPDAKRHGIKGDEKGVVVTEVQPGSPAAEAGMRPGDVIKEVNRERISNLKGFRQAVEKAKGALLLLVKRDDKTFYVALTDAGQ